MGGYLVTVNSIIDSGNEFFDKYNSYMKEREYGRIPVKNTDTILREINIKLLVYKNTIDNYRNIVGMDFQQFTDPEVISKITQCFKEVVIGFKRIDKIRKNPVEDLIEIILNQKKEILIIEDKFNLAPTAEERMWLKFIYLEYNEKICVNLLRLKNQNEKIFNTDINYLIKKLPVLEKNLLSKTNSFQELMAKYPDSINEKNVTVMLHLYDNPEVWGKIFGHTREETTVGLGEEARIAHQELVNEFSGLLKNILQRFESRKDSGGGGGGGGGAKDEGDWRADFDTFTNGFYELQNPTLKTQVKSPKRIEEAQLKAQAIANQLLEEEATAKAANPNKGAKATKGAKASKRKKKSKGASKGNVKGNNDMQSVAASAASVEGHKVTLEETVQKAMYGELPAGTKFAEVKRVKRWDIPDLDAASILEKPKLFPEYRGLGEREINHQILLHSGNRLHRLLMDRNLERKYANQVDGGFTMDAILFLKDGKQYQGRYEFGVGKVDQKVYHRGFRIHMWGRDFQNLDQIHLDDGKIGAEAAQDQEEEEFRAVGGSTVSVDEEGNIIVNLENHMFLTGYTILPKR